MDAMTFWGHLFLFLTTISGFIYQWKREQRLHEWQRQEFKSVKAEIRNGHGGSA